MSIALLSLLLAVSGPGGEIAERLAAPPSFTLTTAKHPEDLELCVADAVSAITTPAAFRDGPNRTVVTGSITYMSTKVIVTVELNGSPSGTSIVGKVMGKSYDDRLRGRIERCL